LYGRDPLTGELTTEVGGAAVFAAFGPEPLDPAYTVGEFRRRLRRRTGRLKPLLLDQSFVAGVGNIYADEALWKARLHPLRTAGTLRPPDERRLYLAVRSILAEAVERRGSSIDDYTADGDGSMQERLEVYQRTGEPCRAASAPSGGSSSRRGRPVSVRGAAPAGRRSGLRAILRTMTGGTLRRAPLVELAGGDGGPDCVEAGCRTPGTDRSDRSVPPRRGVRRHAAMAATGNSGDILHSRA
jgi:hypothetical protein